MATIIQNSKPYNNKDDDKEIILDKKSFTTEDLRTSIFLLTSKDRNVVLKAVGTLCRYATRDEKYLEQYFSHGIYEKLINLLEQKDMVILKYALKLFAMLANNKFLSMAEFKQVLICSEIITRWYIDCRDVFVEECCSFILKAYVKYSEVITNNIYSDTLIKKIFDILKTTQDIDVLFNSITLFNDLLDIELAKEDIHRNNIFSTKIILCLVDFDQDGVDEIAMDILVKLSKWRHKETTLYLQEQGLLKRMSAFVLNNDENFIDKAFDVLENCLTNEKCSLEFGNTLEFAEYIRWLQRCSNRHLLRSLPIIYLFSKHPDLRQRLYDLNFDQMMLDWLKYQHEDFVYHYLRIVINLTDHKRFIEALAKFVVLKNIKELIFHEDIPMQPQGELAVEAIRNFVVRAPETIHFLVNCDGIPLIQDLFVKSQDELNPSCYKFIFDILQAFASSKYVDEVFKNHVLHKLLYLFKENYDLRLRALNLMNMLGKYEKFRLFLIIARGIEALIEGLKNENTSFGTQLYLQVILNLSKYEELGFRFLNYDLMQLMKSIKPQINLTIVDDIINTLYNYCPTMKFFETGRLESYNRLDDHFYLIQDRLPQSSVESLTFASNVKPVYVVSVKLVKITKEIEESAAKYGSLTSVEVDANTPSGKKRVLRTSSIVASNPLKLKASYEHGEIPKDILYFRCINSESKDNQYYEDYYLERYILMLFKELYFTDNAPETLRERIQHIAKYVDRQLSGIMENLKEYEKATIFQRHLENLKSSVGMNVIPIGYLRMGFQCERSLLFKVLCDNLCVPTTLCRGKEDAYWNEITFTVRYENGAYVREEDTVYVVDLMNIIGELMPFNSREAQEYMQKGKMYRV